MKRVIVIFVLVVCVLQGLHSQDYLSIKRLPISTRTYYEFAAFPSADGNEIIYMSDRPLASMTKTQNSEGQSFPNIYKVAREDSKWGQGKLFSETFHSDYFDGPACFARNDKLLCLARAYIVETGDAGKNSNQNSGLYFSTFTGEEWSAPEPFQHNDLEYVYYSPFLTPAGDTLYFAANMEDTRGGFDIYVSYMKNGDWTEPENLGDQVNSEMDELFPSIHKKSGRLYFSSKGHDTSSDFDIFYCNPVFGGWSNPVKLPPPINARSADDYALWLSDDFSEGFFTSKRMGGGTDDIFEIYSDFPIFSYPSPIRKNRFCFRLRETSLDTIDYNIFDYEWVINDTLHLPGHSVKYCFPGPGDYYMSFIVTNKITDTIVYNKSSLFLNLELVEQPVISCPDTIIANSETTYSAENTYLPNIDIGTYYWDFGDGGKNTGEVVKHTYVSPGRYSVILGVEEKVKNRRDEPDRVAVFKEIVVIPAQ